MAGYLIIESRDPFESNDVQATLQLAAQLAKDKNDVTLLLVGNGVAAARPSERSKAFSEVAKSGVKLLADDFSLKERGIAKLADGFQQSPIDVVVDALAASTKTLWR